VSRPVTGTYYISTLSLATYTDVYNSRHVGCDNDCEGPDDCACSIYEDAALTLHRRVGSSKILSRHTPTHAAHTSIPTHPMQASSHLDSKKTRHRSDHKSESPTCTFANSECVDCSDDDDALICDVSRQTLQTYLVAVPANSWTIAVRLDVRLQPQEVLLVPEQSRACETLPGEGGRVSGRGFGQQQ
jgi:hypothetical protein